MRKISLVLLAAAMIFAAGCKKDHDTVTLSASIDYNNSSKLYINGVTPCWNGGDNADQVFVNSQIRPVSNVQGGVASITGVNANTSTSNLGFTGYRAFYPADMIGEGTTTLGETANVELPLNQTYETTQITNNNQTLTVQKVRVPMSAYAASGTSLTFHNLCSLIKVKVINSTGAAVTLKRITVAAKENHLSGPGTATLSGIGDNDFSDGYDGDLITMGSQTTPNGHEVRLLFSNTQPVLNYTGEGEYFIVAPAFTETADYEDDITIWVHTTDGKYFKVDKHGALPPNHIANVTITLTNNDAKDDKEFTVGDGVKVKFSPGNLQYKASTNTWRFAENQWDFVGGTENGTHYGTVEYSDNGNIGNSEYTGWIDLFGWGTGNNPTLHTNNNSDYSSFNEWNKTYSGFNCTCIPGNWRTLTADEWETVLTSREDCSTINGVQNVRFARATIVTEDNIRVPGMILFPDGYCWPESITKYPPFNEGTRPTGTPASEWAGYSTEYSTGEWTILKNAGAIFLPSTGVRNRQTFSFGTGSGQYWSSTENTGSSTQAANWYFNEGTYNIQTISYRYSGRSVRLVQEITQTPATK